MKKATTYYAFIMGDITQGFKIFDEQKFPMHKYTLEQVKEKLKDYPDCVILMTRYDKKSKPILL